MTRHGWDRGISTYQVGIVKYNMMVSLLSYLSKGYLAHCENLQLQNCVTTKLHNYGKMAKIPRYSTIYNYIYKCTTGWVNFKSIYVFDFSMLLIS